MFHDITTLLPDPKAFKNMVDLFAHHYTGRSISIVAGVESKGFIFGPPTALAIGAKFIPLRKPKQLPGEVIFEEYILEYGSDRLEMHTGAVEPEECALVVDDLIATGGTLRAAINLLDLMCHGVGPVSSFLHDELALLDCFKCCHCVGMPLERAGAEVVECVCVIELPDLKLK